MPAPRPRHCPVTPGTRTRNYTPSVWCGKRRRPRPARAPPVFKPTVRPASGPRPPSPQRLQPRVVVVREDREPHRPGIRRRHRRRPERQSADRLLHGLRCLRLLGETTLPASGPRPVRVRSFESHRAARVRSASGPRPLPFLPTGGALKPGRQCGAPHRLPAPGARSRRRWPVGAHGWAWSSAREAGLGGAGYTAGEVAGDVAAAAASAAATATAAPASPAAAPAASPVAAAPPATPPAVYRALPWAHAGLGMAQRVFGQIGIGSFQRG
eukprot:gene15755-biopygen11251